MKSIKRLIVPAVLLLVVGMVLGIKVESVVSDSDTLRHLEKLQEAFMIVHSHYVDDVNAEDAAEYAIQGMLEELDPHSIYISPEEIKEVQEGIKGSFGGVGIWFEIVEDTARVISTVPEGPSEAAGVMAGDRIVQIDDSSAIGFTNNDVVQFEHAGTPVRTITPEKLPLAGSGMGAHEDVDGAALAAVLAATYRGVQDVIDDPEGAVAIAAEHVPGLADAAAREAALATLEATIELYGAADGRQDPALWEQMAAFMADHDLLEGEVDPAAAMTNEFLE